MMMKMMTISQLLLLLLLAATTIVTADRTETPHQACSVPDLTAVCPDENVSKEGLESHCLGLHGIPAAKCYFEYVCNHHDQDAVDKHRECIEGECPLVRRMGFYNCSQHVVSYDEEATTDEPDEADKPSSSGGGGGGGGSVTNNEEDNNANDEEEGKDAGAASPEATEVIHEDTVTVSEPAKEEEDEDHSKESASGGADVITAASVNGDPSEVGTNGANVIEGGDDKEEAEEQKEEADATEAPKPDNKKDGGKHMLGTVALIGAITCVGLLMFVFREKIAAWAAGNHPGDKEIVNFAPAQNSEMA